METRPVKVKWQHGWIGVTYLFCCCTAFAVERLPGLDEHSLLAHEVQFYRDSGDVFGALTRVAHFAKTRPSVDQVRPVVPLLSDLYLGYALPKEAESVLRTALVTAGSGAGLDRAWFNVARGYYEQGRYADAERILAQLTHGLSGDADEERSALAGQLRMARQDYHGAAEIFALARGWTGWGQYSAFNRAIALMASGETKAGLKALKTLTGLSASNAEMRALRDQVHLTLGAYYLRRQDAAEALRYLKAVRLDAPAANAALRSMGWAYTLRKQYREALGPWRALRNRPITDEHVLEAYTAIPYALTRLGASGAAVQAYEEALRVLQEQQTQYAAAATAWISDEIALARLSDGGDLRGLQTIPGWPTAPLARVLAVLVQDDQFIHVLRDVQDARHIVAHCAEDRERLTRLQGIAAPRRESLLQKIDTLSRDAQTSVDEHARYLHARVAEQLERERQDISLHLEQTRLALAQAYEQLNHNGGAP